MNLEEKRCVFKNKTGATMFTVGEKVVETFEYFSSPENVLPYQYQYLSQIKLYSTIFTLLPSPKCILKPKGAPKVRLP